MIKTKNLNKVFKGGIFEKKTVALRNLNLHVRRGEIFGYLGPNGAGKTTSIKLFVGLIKPTSGEVKIAGEDIHHPQTREKIGFLPENPFFYDYLTAEEFLNFYASIHRFPRKIRREKIDFLLNLTGLYTVRKKQLRVFSKGMIQRIGMAQALIGEPELIILDEPMTGLDPIGRKTIRDLILQLKKEGKTIFFSTHILSDVEVICDRVGILVDGELKSCASLDEILKEESVKIEVVASKMQPSSYKELEDFSERIERKGEQVFLKINTEEELNKILKLSVDKKLVIESINRSRRRLEEIFLRNVK